jgi:hypothetical protein
MTYRQLLILEWVLWAVGDDDTVPYIENQRARALPAPKSCPPPQNPHPYPGCGQDPQGKETGSKQVPESMPVKLKSHGQQHSPQQIQHLGKEDSRGWASAMGDSTPGAGPR